MSKSEEEEVLRFVQGKDLVSVMSIALKGLDVSEIVNLIILSGRGYSAKLLKFFKWYCQVMPIFIMVFHIACMYVFAQHSKEMADDPDQADGFVFNRFYADCNHNGVGIPWDDVL